MTAKQLQAEQLKAEIISVLDVYFHTCDKDEYIAASKKALELQAQYYALTGDYVDYPYDY